MKTLLTKMVFISFIFSTVAPVAIKADEIVNPEFTILTSDSASVTVPTASGRFFSGLKGKATSLWHNLGKKTGEGYSYTTSKAGDVYNYAGYQAAKGKSYLTRLVTKNPNEAQIAVSSLATLLTAGGVYGIYTAVKNGVMQNKKRFVVSTLSAVAGLAGFYGLAVQNGYASNPFN